MNTGFHHERVPLHGGLAVLRPGDRERGSARRSSSCPIARGLPAGGLDQLDLRLPARRPIRAWRSAPPGRADRRPLPARRRPIADDRRAGIAFLAGMNREYLRGRTRATRPWRPASAPTSWPAGCRSSIPEAVDLDGEPPPTRRLLRAGRARHRGFGRNCLLARRLIERGVRFVQLYTAGRSARPGSTGTPTRTSSRTTATQAASHGPAARRPADRPQGPRDARRHAGPLDHRVRPDAVHPGIGGKGRDHHQGLHLLDGRRRA